METCIQDRLIGVLEFVLGKLARYDEGNPIGALLSMAKTPVTQQQSTGHMGNSYVTFMRGCTEQLRQIVTDEVWKVYSDFELQGIDEEKLNGKLYQSINRRLQLEEANVALHEHSNNSPFS
ncbi:hypothetical protein TELCIR_15845 [Teladorsagia circumcincta]|uniref:Uncharacterized protein n=1 Tax=Teladorsagia circumcincta TaxID=45464 RepID=A0A2G9TX56_TELCI|nr:hypothetical protein TELCIR_15845 [Teladorsagia circumcincta]